MGTVWRRVICGALALMLVIQLEVNSKNIEDARGNREDKLNELSETCAEKCNLIENADVKCVKNQAEEECICINNKEIFDYRAKECKECSCFQNTKPCRIEDGKPKCECLDNFYMEDDGICVELTEACAEKCNLPANEGNVICDEQKSEDMCVCTANEKKFDYQAKDCKQCVCGENTKPCRFVNGEPICECMDGYFLMGTECKELTETCVVKCNLPANEGNVICDEQKSEDMCVCTANEKKFDYQAKDCKQCVCKKNTKPCRIEDGYPKCECLDEYYLVDGICYELSKTCLEKCNLPANKNDVKCLADQFGDECACKENEKMFDYQDKSCKPLSENCLKKCDLPKNKEDVKCVKTESGEVCVCNEYNKLFHYKTKACKKLSKTCAQKCNLPENEENVKCVENQFGEECVCIENEKMFDNQDKSCKPLSKDCLEKCNLPKNKEDVKCVKNHSEELCVCNEYKKMFHYKAKECKTLSKNCALRCNLPEKEEEITCVEKSSKDSYSISCKCTDKRKLFHYLSRDCKECYCGEHMESCELGADGYPKCKCKRKYTLVNGNCEEEKSDCESDNDCHNGARCFRSECRCWPKTSGKWCQIIDCSSIDPHCRWSGGSCRYDVTRKSVFCECQKPKTFNIHTRRCEDSCAFGSCQNGGTCIVLENTVKCLCRASFSGEMCENDTEKMKLALWILCSIVAVLVVIVGTTLFIRCQKK